MPELYTFVTEITDNIEIIKEVEEALKEWKVESYTINQFGDTHTHYFISGWNWEEDCGYPINLMLVFENSGLTCVYCNNHLYGLIDGGKHSLYFNTTSEDVKHYK